MADHAERDVIVVEVGPRDGLQNEAQPVPTERKIAFINALSAAGLPLIEATSFVNPRAVPQMADAGEVMQGITRYPGVRYPVLVPNERGLDRAINAAVDAIALFTAATDEFARANVGTTIAGTFERFSPVIEQAKARGMWVRGYVSVAFGCPYAGAVSVDTVTKATSSTPRPAPKNASPTAARSASLTKRTGSPTAAASLASVRCGFHEGGKLGA